LKIEKKRKEISTRCECDASMKERESEGLTCVTVNAEKKNKILFKTVT
jgi:hypothetical protein